MALILPFWKNSPPSWPTTWWPLPFSSRGSTWPLCSTKPWPRRCPGVPKTKEKLRRCRDSSAGNRASVRRLVWSFGAPPNARLRCLPQRRRRRCRHKSEAAGVSFPVSGPEASDLPRTKEKQTTLAAAVPINNNNNNPDPSRCNRRQPQKDPRNFRLAAAVGGLRVDCLLVRYKCSLSARTATIGTV